MKVVKEILYEKFIEDSDPISDMGIGGYTYEALKPGAIIKAKREGIAVTRNGSGRFTNYLYGMKLSTKYPLVVYLIKDYGEGYKRIYFYKIYNPNDAHKIRNLIINSDLWFDARTQSNNMIVSKRMFNNKFEIIERGF